LIRLLHGENEVKLLEWPLATGNPSRFHAEVDGLWPESEGGTAMRRLPLTILILIVFPVLFTYIELHEEFSFGSLDRWLPLLLAFLATATILSPLWLTRKSTLSNGHRHLMQLELKQGHRTSSNAGHARCQRR